MLQLFSQTNVGEVVDSGHGWMTARVSLQRIEVELQVGDCAVAVPRSRNFSQGDRDGSRVRVQNEQHAELLRLMAVDEGLDLSARHSFCQAFLVILQSSLLVGVADVVVVIGPKTQDAGNDQQTCDERHDVLRELVQLTSSARQSQSKSIPPF
jgi:hypothetical protein